MVSQNPLMAGRWTIKKLEALVINDIWPEMLVFTGIATMVVCVSKFTDHHLGINNALLTVLGTVLGLVISFRTSTAYERYGEGRKLWTTIGVASRNISQQIWVHVANKRVDKYGQEIQSELQSIIEKKTMINLVQGLSVATKHALRGEVGVYYEDLYPLISCLPRFHSGATEGTIDDMLPLWRASEDDDDSLASPVDKATIRSHTMGSGASTPALSIGGDPEKGISKRQLRLRSKDEKYRRTLGNPNCHRPLKPSRNPPQAGFFDYFPVFRFFRFIGRGCTRRTKEERAARKAHKRPLQVDSNVPLEIALYLSSYLSNMMAGGHLQAPLATAILANLTLLQDTCANLDRIRNTPLPFAYQAHLRMSLWIYLALLPFQVEATLNWLTIPGTLFATFLLCGFLEIGQEIENPFNYDVNDLDLDSFCLAIHRELAQITAHTMPTVSSYVFSEWNQPLAPIDRRTAAALTHSLDDYEHDGKKGESSLRRALVRNWREIDLVTRSA